MHDPESVLMNESLKILLDFEIQTDHLISARRSNIAIGNKKKKRIYRIVDFADHRAKSKDYEMRDKYQDFARELKI